MNMKNIEPKGNRVCDILKTYEERMKNAPDENEEKTQQNKSKIIAK